MKNSKDGKESAFTKMDQLSNSQRAAVKDQ